MTNDAGGTAHTCPTAKWEPLAPYLDSMRARGASRRHGARVHGRPAPSTAAGWPPPGWRPSGRCAHAAPLRRLPGDAAVRAGHRRPQAVRRAQRARLDARARARSSEPGGADPRARADPHAAGHALAGRGRARCSTRPAGTEPRDLRDRALLELLYGCGLRAAEVCGLRLADVASSRARCASPARASSASCRSAAPPAAALDRYLARAARPGRRRGRCDRLFVSVRGRPLHPSDVRRALERALDGRASRTARRTPCGTPSPPICSRAAPISVVFRTFWAMHRSARPRYTPTSACAT